MIKRLSVLFGMIGLLGLTYIFATRLSDQALAIIIGFGLGTLASLPTGLMVILALRQRDRAPDPPRLPMSSGYAGQQPPIFIVTGSGASQVPFGPTPPPAIGYPDGRRSFTIVGDDSTEP